MLIAFACQVTAKTPAVAPAPLGPYAAIPLATAIAAGRSLSCCWLANLISATSGNRFFVAQSVPYATAGVRLVLTPR
ncbi:MAG: hypothetical protein ACOCZK_06750 [Planctomycetota bacterium]